MGEVHVAGVVVCPRILACGGFELKLLFQAYSKAHPAGTAGGLFSFGAESHENFEFTLERSARGQNA